MVVVVVMMMMIVVFSNHRQGWKIGGDVQMILIVQVVHSMKVD